MKIAVIFGGMSSERDVSIASGAQVFKALKLKEHDVIAVDTATGILTSEEEKLFLESTIKETPPEITGFKLLRKGLTSAIESGKLNKVDICFLAFHGGAGEDGTVQGYLDVMGIPYTGSTHMPCSYAMDKEVSKILFRAAGVTTPDWLMACNSISPEDTGKKLGLPLVIKPNKEGSTVGLSVVKSLADFEKALTLALQYDKEVLIETFIPGREFTVGVLDGKALGVGEIIPKFSEIFDYKSKYQKGGADEIFPAHITEAEKNLVMKEAEKATQALKIQDYCRVDFRMDNNGKFWCLEVNTLPGMTSASLLPQSAAVMGISFPDLCEKICTLAIDRQKKV